MKKSLLALAVLSAFAGVASAQSSVTLYGTIDLNARYMKNDGSNRRYSLGQDGINSSQLGFRGVEDLGGGLKASFVLLAGVNADTGTTNAKFFSRRSTVSLSSAFGELRLGRDYVPTFWNQTIFDPFGTNGIGDSTNVRQLQIDAIGNTFVRADNTIGYFLPPNLGGIYGQVMVAAAEGAIPVGGVGNPGRYIGGRLGFAAGPVDIAGAAAEQRIIGSAEDLTIYNIGGSFDFGFGKLMGYYDRSEFNNVTDDRFSVGAVVPIGQFEIHAVYNRSKLDTAVENVVDKFAVGGVYNLSKRTAMYGTYARLSNDGASNRSLVSPTNPSVTAAPSFGGKSQGAEFGVRHFF